MLVALAHGHVQHAGAREAWPPVVEMSTGRWWTLARSVKIPVLDYDVDVLSGNTKASESGAAVWSAHSLVTTDSGARLLRKPS